MKIRNLHLTNFRCFDTLDVSFNIGSKDGENTTVLVAKNGEGKTAILDAINVAIGPFIGKMPQTFGAGFSADDVKQYQGKQQGQLNQGKQQGQLTLESVFEIPDSKDTNQPLGDSQITVKRELTSSKKKPTTTTKDAKDLTKYAQYLFSKEKEEVIWPLLAYYGDNRLWATGRVTENKKTALLKRERAYGYFGATNSNSGHHEFEKWYADLCNSIWRSERQQQSQSLLFKPDDLAWYRLLNEILAKALKQALAITGWTKLEYDVDKKIMAIHENTGDIVPWTSLSAGNRIVTGLVADIAHRCGILNPWLKEDVLSKTSGIVLIDEIELHLHPSWQQCILPTLQKIFPKIQFIVTTHSPQVISSVPKECIRIIDSGKVVPFSTPTQGVDVGDILAGILGTDPIPQNSEIAQKLNLLHVMLSEGNGDTVEWETLYQELEQYYGKDYPPLLGTKSHRDFLKKMKAGAHNA